jgi:hypothetical protein
MTRSTLMRLDWLEPLIPCFSTWRGVRSESSSPQISTTHGSWRSTGPARPGIISFRGGAYSDAEMLGLLDRVLTQTPALDLEGSIIVVDRRHIRPSLAHHGIAARPCARRKGEGCRPPFPCRAVSSRRMPPFRSLDSSQCRS